MNAQPVHQRSASTRRNLLGGSAGALAGLTAFGLSAPTDAFASAPTDWINVKLDFGAAGDGVADDTTAIQNAITNAGSIGGVVYFPPGTYAVSDELVLPNVGPGRGLGIQLLGSGPLSSVLWWPSDLGPGTYAVRCDVEGYRGIRDLGLVGPGTDHGYGNPPCDMSGLLTSSHLLVNNVRVTNFFAGIEKVGHHQVFERYESDSCYYGVYMTTPDAGNGNVSWYDCILDGKMAAIGIAGDQAPNDETFVHCHLNSAPYGVFGEPGSASLMIGFVFYNTGWEGMGVAMIGCGEENRNLHDCVFHRAGFIWDDGRKLGGVTRNAWIETGGEVDHCRFEALSAEIAVSPSLYPQAAPIKATALTSCSFDDMHPACFEELRNAGIPFYTGGGICDSSATMRTSRYKILRVQGGFSVAQDEFVTFIQFQEILPYGTAGITIPGGVACNNGSGGDAVLVCVEGPASVRVAGASVSQRDILVPDVTSPTEAAPGVASDRSIMGYALNSGAAGSVTTIWLHPQF